MDSFGYHMWMCWIAAGSAPECPIEVPADWRELGRHIRRTERQSPRDGTAGSGFHEPGRRATAEPETQRSDSPDLGNLP